MVFFHREWVKPERWGAEYMLSEDYSFWQGSMSSHPPAQLCSHRIVLCCEKPAHFPFHPFSTLINYWDLQFSFFGSDVIIRMKSSFFFFLQHTIFKGKMKQTSVMGHVNRNRFFVCFWAKKIMFLYVINYTYLQSCSFRKEKKKICLKITEKKKKDI